MKRRLILAMPLLVTAGAARAQTWTDYRTDDGRFHIQMPGPPTVGTVPVPLAGGEKLPMTEAVAQQGRTPYLASWVDYPDRISRAVSTDLLLDRVRDGMAAGSTLRGEKKLTLGRYPGREFVVVQSGGANTAVRLYWVRGRLYQLTVTGGAGIETRPDTRRFLESFELVAQR